MEWVTPTGHDRRGDRARVGRPGRPPGASHATATPLHLQLRSVPGTLDCSAGPRSRRATVSFDDRVVINQRGTSNKAHYRALCACACNVHTVLRVRPAISGPMPCHPDPPSAIRQARRPHSKLSSIVAPQTHGMYSRSHVQRPLTMVIDLSVLFRRMMPTGHVHASACLPSCKLQMGAFLTLNTVPRSPPLIAAFSCVRRRGA